MYFFTERKHIYDTKFSVCIQNRNDAVPWNVNRAIKLRFGVGCTWISSAYGFGNVVVIQKQFDH